jgi:hypothetical protein
MKNAIDKIKFIAETKDLGLIAIAVLGLIAVIAIAVLLVIAIKNGETETIEVLDPANPASPVRQLLHQTTGF